MASPIPTLLLEDGNPPPETPRAASTLAITPKQPQVSAIPPAPPNRLLLPNQPDVLCEYVFCGLSWCMASPTCRPPSLYSAAASSGSFSFALFPAWSNSPPSFACSGRVHRDLALLRRHLILNSSARWFREKNEPVEFPSPHPLAFYDTLPCLPDFHGDVEREGEKRSSN